MKNEVVLMLTELRSQINDTIMRIEKESMAEVEEIVSTFMSYKFVDMCDLLGEESTCFLEYMEDCGFIKTEREDIYIPNRLPFTQYKIVSVHEWIGLVPGEGWMCHPALIALYKNHLKNS